MEESHLKAPSSEDTVVLPNHLQALAAECSHLSFGTYKGGNNSSSSGNSAPNNLSRSGFEMNSAAVDDSLVQFPDARHFLFRFHLLMYSALSIATHSHMFSFCIMYQFSKPW
jgi:hypothetical protein